MRRETTGLQLLAISISLFAALAQEPRSAAAEKHSHDEETDENGNGEAKKGPHGEVKEHEEEGRIELSPEAMMQSGLSVMTSGPAQLNITLSLTGKLVPHEDRVAHITPRFAGVIREVKKRLGDPVARGETVAVIENNQTLQSYEVKSQIPGMVVRRHATVGESVTDTTTLFVVADYGELFVDLFVFPKDHKKVRLGQRVLIQVPGKLPVESAISFLSPVTDADTQSRFIRAVLTNPSGEFQAGSFISGDLVLEQAMVPIAVHNSALRLSEGKTVVFVEEDPGHFEARPVFTGRKDKDNTEILVGLKPNERYAVGNTFILQAEQEKGEAEHEH